MTIENPSQSPRERSEAPRGYGPQLMEDQENELTNLMTRLQEVQREIDALAGGANKNISETRDIIVSEDIAPLEEEKARLKEEIEQKQKPIFPIQ